MRNSRRLSGMRERPAPYASVDLRVYMLSPIRYRIGLCDLPPENGSRPYVRIMWFLDLKGRSGYDKETAYGGAGHREAA